LECLQFVSILQDFLYLFSHLPIARPSIHLFCQLPFSIIFPMFWFSTNVEGGVTERYFFDIPKVFIVIPHILSSILEISLYSIIDSNVFGVKIGENFPLTIIK
jgi:hypothetical protein